MKIDTAWIAAAALALSLSACGSGEAKPQAAADKGKGDKEAVAIPVEVAEVTTGPIDATYRGTATIEATGEAVVVARTSGVVEEILVEEGDRVEAGQPLARLETERLELEVERSRANLAQAEQAHRRNESLYRQKLISREVYDRSRYELDAARAAYELADLTLREAVIRAPFGGVVSARYIKVGNMVQANARAFEVTQLDTLEARIHVPERDIYKLADGQPAIVSVEAWPREPFVGKVERINPVVDPATGTVKVTVVLADRSGRLKPGMFGRVEIRYDRHENAILAPRDAVLIEDASESVFVVNAAGQAERRAIKVGYADDRHVEVLEGLSPGERVVTTGQTNLKDRSKVEVVETLVVREAG